MGAWRRVLVAGERKAASKCQFHSGVARRRAVTHRAVFNRKVEYGERSRITSGLSNASTQAVHAGGESALAK